MATNTFNPPTQQGCTHHTGKDFRHGKHTRRHGLTNSDSPASATGCLPKKRVFCPDCMHSKMRFATRREAERFIAYNAEAIAEASGYAPQRAYYCQACRGWHITSKEHSPVKAQPAVVRHKWYRLEKCIRTALRRIHHRKLDEAQRVFRIAFDLYEACLADGVSQEAMDIVLRRLTECVDLWLQTERDNGQNRA